MKIALFETGYWERAACRRLLPDHEVACTREPLIREEAEVFRSERRGTEDDPRALLADRVLPHFPSVIVTPHIAFDTDGASRRIIDTTLENFAAFVQGRRRNVVSDVGDKS